MAQNLGGFLRQQIGFIRDRKSRLRMMVYRIKNKNKKIE